MGSPPKDQGFDPNIWGAFLRGDQPLLPSPSDPNEKREGDERISIHFCIISYGFEKGQGVARVVKELYIASDFCGTRLSPILQ